MQFGVKPQQSAGFLGVNLRQERVSLADGDVAKAINADLHSQPGTLVKRLGRTRQFSTALTDLLIRRLAKVNNGRRYQVAGRTLYRDQVAILTGLSGNMVTTLQTFRPLNDTTLWMYIADDAVMRKDNGTTAQAWGIIAPTATPVIVAGVAGSLTGDYRVRYTYIRKVGTALVSESNPSPVSAAVTLAAQVLDISSLVPSTDGQITHYRIYRTAAGGNTYLFDQDVAIAAVSATSTQADTALGGELETDNDGPPLCSWVFEHQESLFLCRDAANPHYLWWSKRFRPDEVPPDNFLEIGNPNDPLLCGLSFAGMGAVFNRLTKYRILGNVTSGFTAVEAPSHRGTPAYNAVIKSEYGIIFPARDGIFMTNLSSVDVELSDAIEPLFFGETKNDMAPIDWSYADKMSAAVYKGRYYLSYVSTASTTGEPDYMAVYSNDTKKWYFYTHPVRSLLVEEDVDALVGGGQSGRSVVLEDGSSDEGSDVTLTVDTKDYVGEEGPNTPKIFHRVRVDADTQSDDVSLDFYLDDTLRHTYTFNSTSRVSRELPLPEGCLGYRWRVTMRYTGTARVRLYDVGAFYLPLGAI